jgi:hypothetical protein
MTPAAAQVPGESCIVAGCGEEVVRHLSLAEARRAFPDLPEQGRRAPLCRTHYRAWKKATRDDRRLERLGR